MANTAEAPLVSVIMPLYNSSKHVGEAIKSVQDQTLDCWELCITDDCSTDDSADIVASIAAEDPRVRLFRQESNQGAAAARNRSLDNARGRFVAYLDADDMWAPEKLERQVAFMEKGGYGFSCASYEVIDEDGELMGRKVTMPAKSDLDGFLANNYLQTIGIMADFTLVEESLLHMPDLSREDAGTWIQVLSAGHACYGIPDVLCFYRRTPGSLSSNKVKAVLGVWHLYRNVAGLGLPKAWYCFVRYAFLAVWKRTYTDKPDRR